LPETAIAEDLLVNAVGKAESAAIDLALLAGITAGDQAAMERLYDRYSPMVLALAVRILRDRAAADELLNDVFMELWNRIDRFDATRGTLATYLLTLARSRAIDRLRARKRQGLVALPEGGMAEPEPDALGAPLRTVVADENKQQLSAALARLPQECRQALELAYFEDLSHSQIAERLARPLGTVKTHIRQGLIQLRDSMRSNMDEPHHTTTAAGDSP
jgi:RNA polymerase sigma-70 factor (ECF subfamily)